MIRNNFGFPVVDNRLQKAQQVAAEIRARNFPPPCDCKECVSARNLPAIQRILAKWQLIGGVV